MQEKNGRGEVAAGAAEDASPRRSVVTSQRDFTAEDAENAEKREGKGMGPRGIGTGKERDERGSRRSKDWQGNGWQGNGKRKRERQERQPKMEGLAREWVAGEWEPERGMRKGSGKMMGAE